MGDTGSLAIGGAIAAFAVLSQTEVLLLLFLGGLFVIITLSVIGRRLVQTHRQTDVSDGTVAPSLRI